MNQSMAIDDLVSVAQAEAMGELDAPMMAIVLSSEQSYDLPINSLETDADKARWGLILRAAREHVEADAVAVLYPAWTTIRRKPTDAEAPQAQAEDEDSADDDNGPIDTLSCSCTPETEFIGGALSKSGIPSTNVSSASGASRRCQRTTTGTVHLLWPRG